MPISEIYCREVVIVPNGRHHGVRARPGQESCRVVLDDREHVFQGGAAWTEKGSN
jgi:hypothetical protein